MKENERLLTLRWPFAILCLLVPLALLSAGLAGAEQQRQRDAAVGVERAPQAALSGKIVNPNGTTLPVTAVVHMWHMDSSGDWRDWEATPLDVSGSDQGGDGSFSLELGTIPRDYLPGPFYLQAEIPEDDPYARSIVRRFSVPDPGIDIALGTVTLTYPSFMGVVYEPDGSTPAAQGGEISVMGLVAGRLRRVAWSEYDETGGYAVGGVPDGEGWLVAHPPEDSIWWESASIAVSVTPGSQYIPTTPPFYALTLQSPNLSGTVVYPSPNVGEPVQWLPNRIGWARVEVLSDSQTLYDRNTAMSGLFGFRVPDGSYRVRAWPQGTLEMTYTASLLRPVSVQAEANSGPLTLTYPSVAGYVRGPAGEVVPGNAAIWLEEQGSGNQVAYDVYSSEEYSSAYRLGGVPGGEYVLRADAPEDSRFFPSEPVTITVAPGSQYDPVATISMPVRLAAPQVEVEVTYPSDDPAPARVVLWNDDYWYESESALSGEPAVFGNLVISQVFKVMAWPLDDDVPTWGNSTQLTVTAPSTGSVSVKLILQQPNVTGTVTAPEGGRLPDADDDGLPVPPARFELHSLDGLGNLEWATAMSGTFSLALPAGDYSLVAYPHGSNNDLYTPAVLRRFTLVDGAPQVGLGAVRLTYPSVTGTIYASAANDPIPGCLDIWLEDGVSGDWLASQWYCGSEPPEPYRLGGVPDGYYWLKTGALPGSDLFPANPVRVHVAPGSQYSQTATQPISLYLTSAQVTARILDPRYWPTTTIELEGRVVLGNEWGELAQAPAVSANPTQFGGLADGQYWVAALPANPDIPALACSTKRWFCIGDSAPCSTSHAVDLLLRFPDVVGTVKAPDGGDLQAYDGDGQPAPPATLRVHDKEWAMDLEVPTSLNGQFSLALADGDYQLVAYPAWSAALTYTKSLRELFALTGSTNRPLNLGDVLLTHPRIEGRVVVSGQGSLVSTGVKVWSDDYSYEDWDTTYTESGEPKFFRFGGLPDGHYFVRAEPPENNPDNLGSSEAYEFDVPPTSTEQIVLQLRAPNFAGSLRFPAGYVPPGVAACPAEGCGVPGASVRVHTELETYEDWASTNADGGFAFSGLAAGSYTLDFFLPDELASQWDPPPPPTRFMLLSPSLLVTGTYHLEPAVRNKRVYGQVLDQHGALVGPGSPAAPGEALIYAYSEDNGQWLRVPANGVGAYELYVRGGRWTLGVKPARDDVDWYFDPAFERTVEFTRSASIAESIGVTLSVVRADFVDVYGSVLDPDGNSPPAGSTWVDLCSDDGRCFGARVNLGRFNLQVVPGEYRVWVRVSDANLAPPANNGFFVVVKGRLTLAPVYLRWATPPGRIGGQVVVSPAGLGLSGATLRGWSDQGDWASAQSVSNGVYALAAFPGYWHVEAALPASLADDYVVLPPRIRESEVAAGQTISGVNFYVRRLDATIRGLVVDDGGSRLGDVEAVVFAQYCPNANTCWSVSEARVRKGTFSLKVVGGYTFTLGIRLPPGSPYIPGPIAPDEDVHVGVGGARSDVRISLLTPGARIHGYVLDADSLARLDIPAAVYASDPAGRLVEDKLGPGKWAYDLPLPLSSAAVTWTVGLWVDPASGYVVSRPNPVQVVVSPAVTDVEQLLYARRLSQVIAGVARLGSPLGAPASYMQVFARGDPAGANAGLYFEARADASGVFTIPVPPGAYLVGAYPPPDASFGYFPPGLVAWDAPADNPVRLVFRAKPPLSQVIEIMGSLSVSPTGAIAADAPILVFGHGSDGRRALVTGTLAGGYRLEVVSSTASAGVTWYVWAAYEDAANNVYYHSQEAEVQVHTTSVPNVNLALEQRPFALPDAICQDVDPSRFTRIFLPPRADLPMPPVLEIQAGTFSETVQVCARPAVAALDGQYLVGFSYEMEARDGAGKLITANFNKKVRFSFYATYESMGGADPASLQVAYYSTAREAWVELEDPFVDPQEDYVFITGKADHFTKMGMMSMPDIEEPSAVRLAGMASRSPASLPVALVAWLVAALLFLALLGLKASRRSGA